MINVSNIERFATHDGPGIRTTVFLKGCMLHCPWCANPETWNIKPILMHDERKCVGCEECKRNCPTSSITFPFSWNMNRCIYCHACENVCLQDAISFSGKEMEIKDIVKEVLKDQDYYKQSHGGVTISGGEPFYQFDAFVELIKELKKNGLHVAVETTGNYSIARLKKVYPYVDLFLMDLKHLNSEKLNKVTGACLDLILDNFKYLSKIDPSKVIVRMPVIPRFNEDMCESVIQFAYENHLPEVNLLPFHTMGKNKWEQLNKEFVYAKDRMMDKSVLTKYVEYGKRLGVLVKVGG